MNIKRGTVSLCNTCYREIPATVETQISGVILKKKCSEHGVQTAMVERDPLFYQHIQSLREQTIYPGYFVDVTRVCNLRCKYCFYALEKEDPEGEYAIDRIQQDCMVNVLRAPFILTGGEPTVRKDIVELIQAVKMVGPVELLTNGVRLVEDDDLRRQVFREIEQHPGTLNLNLSMHPQTEAWHQLLDLCILENKQVESVLIVIDSEREFEDALDIVQTYKHAVTAWRIKAASRIWAEQKPEGKIFVSDMIKWMGDCGPYRIIPGRGNKTSIVNVAFDGAHIMLVSWFETANVDLCEIDCAPYYRARNGQVENFVTASLINEGMEQGWLHGRKL